MSQRPGARIQAVEDARNWVMASSGAFANDDAILAAGQVLFDLGPAIEACECPDEYQLLREMLDRVRQELHARLATTLQAHQEGAASVPIAIPIFPSTCQRHHLDELEVEILLLMILASFGMLSERGRANDVDDLQNQLQPCAVAALRVARALAPGGRLVSSGLVVVGERDTPMDTNITLSMDLLHALWHGQGRQPWSFTTEEEAYDRARSLVMAASRQMTRLEDDECGSGSRAEVQEMPPQIAALCQGYRAGLAEHPRWPITRMLHGLDGHDTMIFLLLLGKELGFPAPDHSLFRGHGLVSALATGPVCVRYLLPRLGRAGALRSQQLMRLCGGVPAGMLEEDDAILREAEFELPSAVRRQLGIQRQWRSRSGRLRQANTTLDKLVLHPEVADAVQQALAGARQPQRLLDDWGLRRAIPYGHGTSLLFTGPPGVGKTATAEAIAAALDKPILVVDYSAIQSCWVGETEKNLVRAFREAADEDAVLFWDEADSVCYNRDSAQRSWEVSQVNMLLKELEVFEGVCILATNRDLVLDPALERRIRRRLRFEPPTGPMAAKIWQKLLPPELPLSGDPDFDSLGALGLTGGQIKNAVLAAAQAAMVREDGRGVSQADLWQAAQTEFGRCAEDRLGFEAIGAGQLG